MSSTLHGDSLLSIYRLDQEIDNLETQETQLSAKEVQVLQRLKSVERTTEDIIKVCKGLPVKWYGQSKLYAQGYNSNCLHKARKLKEIFQI